MTLDEAIEHCEEKAKCGDSCGMEHKQLAEWLKELKKYREQEHERREKSQSCFEKMLSSQDWDNEDPTNPKSKWYAPPREDGEYHIGDWIFSHHSGMNGPV